MSFDFYAYLAGQLRCPTIGELPAGLAGGGVDGCTTWFAQGEMEKKPRDANRKKADARKTYRDMVEKKDLLPDEVAALLDSPFDVLHPGWLGIQISFRLKTPWYSKDDRSFHLLDNPVRKDRVFGVPFMSATSWKGLLRWACRMEHGLLEHLHSHDGKLNGWEDTDWIIHLFGNEKGEEESFGCAALAFYPTWFPRVGFEVINPHSRKTRSGTRPIYYEVVPPDTKGNLRILYAPLPYQAENDGSHSLYGLDKLLVAISKLLSVYGFSARRTAGWGLAEIERWKVCNENDSREGKLEEAKQALKDLLG